jgi:hypothetical protein
MVNAKVFATWQSADLTMVIVAPQFAYQVQLVMGFVMGDATLHNASLIF